MKEVAEFIREIGFPVGVAVFVLWRLETRLVEISTALIELRVCLLRRDPQTRDRASDKA